MRPRYLVCPGPVTSRADGDRHYIDAPRLIRLYGVDPRECLVWRDDLWGPMPECYKELVLLRPRYDGDYRTPE